MGEHREDFIWEVKRILRQILAWGTFTIALAWLCGDQFLVPGLLAGTAASIIYFLFMCYRVKKSAELPAVKAVAYMRHGWLIRLGFIVLILILSLKAPQIHFLAAVAGLFSLQIVIFLNAIFLVGRKYLSKKSF